MTVANPIIIPCYASAAARDADYFAPFAGAVVSRTDLKTLEIYDGDLHVWNDLTFESEFSSVTANITVLQAQVAVLQAQVEALQEAVMDAKATAVNAQMGVDTVTQTVSQMTKP
jgi:hypothetical protein